MKIIEKIKNWLAPWKSDDFIDRLAFRVADIVEQAVYYKFFSEITLEELKEIVDKGFQNRKEKGHTDYVDLASFFKQMKDKQVEKEEKDWENTWIEFRVREEANRKKEEELWEREAMLEEKEEREGMSKT